MTRFRMSLLIGFVLLGPPAVAEDETATERMRRMSARVDELLARRWSEVGVAPAPTATDDEFLRRANLDLTGLAPGVADIHMFSQDPSPNKRAVWIARLIRSPRFSTHMAITWRNILLAEGVDLQQAAAAQQLQNWLRRQFHENLRYDNLVAEFLTTSGAADAGPGLYYTSLEVKPEKLASSTSRIFLGLQMQCAECHDHPFDEQWKQHDFWGYAAFFARLRSDGEGRPAMRLNDVPAGEVTLPETDQVVSPRYPGGRREFNEGEGPRRLQLAIWMASRDNPYLARAAVNRAWSILFGRGLVDPVDDMNANNPPSHPQLLDELADYFSKNEFDWRMLLETLANTQAYQASSSIEGERPAADLFACMAVKTLTAEQIYDTLHRNVFRRPQSDAASPPQGPEDARRWLFINRMKGNARNALDYSQGVPQALMMMNGPEVAEGVDLERSGLLQALEAPLFTDEQRLENLFLATVSRPPRPKEAEPYLAILESTDSPSDRRLVLSDFLWALLNSAEFATCP